MSFGLVFPFSDMHLVQRFLLEIKPTQNGGGWIRKIGFKEANYEMVMFRI